MVHEPAALRQRSSNWLTTWCVLAVGRSRRVLGAHERPAPPCEPLDARDRHLSEEVKLGLLRRLRRRGTPAGAEEEPARVGFPPRGSNAGPVSERGESQERGERRAESGERREEIEERREERGGRFAGSGPGPQDERRAHAEVRRVELVLTCS